MKRFLAKALKYFTLLNMRKPIISIIAMILCVGYGVLSWDIVTHSEPPGPEDSPYASICSKRTDYDSAAPETNYDKCCIDYYTALEAVKQDWLANLIKITNQERPASDMVEDAYESLRTYNCWAEYICKAVFYSSYAPADSSIGTGLKEEHIGTVPGCQDPDNLRMEHEYNQFLHSLKDEPLLGVPADMVDQAYGFTDIMFENILAENKINYFPRCQTGNELLNNEYPSLEDSNANYEGCKLALELQFGCPDDTDNAFCPEFSSAFVKM